MIYYDSKKYQGKERGKIHAVFTSVRTEERKGIYFSGTSHRYLLN